MRYHFERFEGGTLAFSASGSRAFVASVLKQCAWGEAALRAADAGRSFEAPAHNGYARVWRADRQIAA